MTAPPSVSASTAFLEEARGHAQARRSVPRRVELGWFHRYPARFATPVALTIIRRVIRRRGHWPAIVLDPYAGSGTVMALCRRLGIPSLGIELSPMGELICAVRMNPPDDPRSLVKMIETWTPGPDGRPIPNELAVWLGAANARTASAYLGLVMAASDRRDQNFLRLALSSALRPASSWLPGSIKPQRDPDRTPSSLLVNVRRAVRALERDCDLERTASHVPSAIIRGDWGSIDVPPATIPAIVTSPPYFVAYDYLDVHRLSFLAFGWNADGTAQLGRRHGIEPDGIGFEPPPSMEAWYLDEFEGERSHLGRALRMYVQTTRRHLRRMYTALEPDGILALAVANSRRRGRRFDLVRAYVELLGEVGFSNIDITTREDGHRRILPAGRDEDTGRFSADARRAVAERVIVARRPLVRPR